MTCERKNIFTLDEEEQRAFKTVSFIIDKICDESLQYDEQKCGKCPFYLFCNHSKALLAMEEYFECAIKEE